MKDLSINIQRIAHTLIVITLSIYAFIIGQPLLSPIAFAALFAFLLIPICDKIERFISFRPAAIILAMLAIIIPVLGAISLFSYQLVTILGDMPSIVQRLETGLDELIKTAQQYLGVSSFNATDWLQSNIGQVLETPLGFLGRSLSSSTGILVGLLFTTLITFFFLLYRTSFYNFMITQFSPEKRSAARKLITDVQRIVQEYLYGLFFVILILGSINSLGLWLIGIKYAPFWGFMAAFLAIIPYIGTTLGGFFPFVYAIATTTTLWQPTAVVILYACVQTIEGNFITPKVVGDSVSINPLTALLFLFIGGATWGISGLILALPFAAILRVVFSYITPLKPIGALLSTGLYRNSQQFLNEYDKEEYRLAAYFKKKTKDKK